jgi:hypothetical protein
METLRRRKEQLILTRPVGSAASVLQAPGFRRDVTVFRLIATAVRQSTPERPFLRHAAERVDAFEAAHNPEVAA